MATKTVGKLAFQVLANTKGFFRDLGKVGRSVKSLGSKVGGLVKKAGAIAAVGLGIRAAFGAANLAGQAANADALATSFDSLAQSIGANSETWLPRLRKATKGAVADIDLMTAANNAVLLGVAKNERSFAQLASGARRLGKAMGRSPVEALNDIVIGIGRQSRLILDNLGIIVKAEQAYAEYAKSIGKSTRELNTAEQRTAFFNAALEAMDERLAKLGPDATSVSESIGKMTSALKNALFDTLVPALKVASPIFEGLGVVAKKVTDLLINQWRDAGITMESALDFVIQHADKVGLLVDFYFELRKASLGFAAALLQIVKLAAQVVKAIGAIPVIGSKIETAGLDEVIKKVNAAQFELELDFNEQRLDQQTIGRDIKALIEREIRFAAIRRLEDEKIAQFRRDQAGQRPVDPNVFVDRLRTLQSIPDPLAQDAAAQLRRFGFPANQEAQKRLLERIEVILEQVEQNTRRRELGAALAQ